MAQAGHTGEAQVTVPPVQRPVPGAPGVAEPGRPGTASTRCQRTSARGGRHPTAVSCRGQTSHSTPTRPRACPENALQTHQRRTRAMLGSGQPGIWPVFQPAAGNRRCSWAQSRRRGAAGRRRPSRGRRACVPGGRQAAGWPAGTNAAERALPVPKAELGGPVGADPAARRSRGGICSGWRVTAATSWPAASA